MITNPVIESMMNRKSIRKYTAEMPSDAVIETIVRAGQQAPFAYQLGSVLLRRDPEANPFNAPLYFIVCVDLYRFERIMERRGWQTGANDLSLMVLGIQDATLMAENMVTAAESLGLGSCFLGAVPYQWRSIRDEFCLPPRVFPLVGMSMGYPASNPEVRPRFPIEYHLFEGRYPELSEEEIDRAAKVMDDGYLAQDYYRKANYIIPLVDAKTGQAIKEETFTFDNYSWTEHISRKIGLWQKNPRDILRAFKGCGFHIAGEAPTESQEG